MRILFGHCNIGQFRYLHEYLNKSGAAESWLLCSEKSYKVHGSDFANLIPYKPHEAYASQKSKLTKPIDILSSVSMGMLPHIKQVIQDQKIDVYCGHVLFGSVFPYQRDLGIPIAYYVEYPSLDDLNRSFRSYRPSAMQLYQDRIFQMLTLQSIEEAKIAISPSNYSRSLFPSRLQHKIIVHPDGFDRLELKDTIVRKGTDRKRIGFCARRLTYSKGLEDFIKIAHLLVQERTDVDIVILGSEETAFSPEMQHLTRHHLIDEKKSFLAYLLEQYAIPPDRLEVHPHQSFQGYINTLIGIDVFLYPLRHGVANWGFYHLMSVGAVIIGSNGCFLPEIIEHGINGYLVDVDNYEEWLQVTLHLLDDEKKRALMKKAVLKTFEYYHIDRVGHSYVEMIEKNMLC